MRDLDNFAVRVFSFSAPLVWNRRAWFVFPPLSSRSSTAVVEIGFFDRESPVAALSHIQRIIYILRGYIENIRRCGRRRNQGR